MTDFDLESVDRLLTTTRAVRKRLDLTRPVPREVLERCLELALQAPSGSNRQGWHFIVVTDPGKRAHLAELYREGAGSYLEQAREEARSAGASQDERVFDSALHLAEHLAEVPVHVIPAIEIPEGWPGSRTGGGGGGEPDRPLALAPAWASLMASIFPAVWSFQLALRSRGLGSTLTTLHLRRAEEAAVLLGIPAGVVQVALLPVAWTVGTDFRPARRRPLEDVVHWNHWGEPSEEGPR